uniref:Zinc finger protein RFP-like n=1 Tax=Podarcis muralis TaxID=64176 RepID=A0A670HY97_PODMU
MAASGGPVMDLCEEATCSICLEYFQDPVIIPECGHNFCRSCLILYWGKSEGEASCPQCRKTVEQGSIRPNQQLANFVEITQKFSHLGGKKEAEGKGRVCEKHQEPLKLFCKEDEAPICLVCDRAKEHKSHEAVPIEEASLEYKISSCLDNMRKERKKILVFKADAEKESQDLLKQMQAEREKMVAEFRRLRQFLEEKEKLLLAQMAEVEKEIAAQREEHLARLSRELSSLDSLIREMEEKLQEPASELLQVRPHPDARGWRVLLQTTASQIPVKNVTLDPDTANPRLILSEDRKSVRWGEVRQDLPDNPERFDTHGYVLGCEGFTSGRHFWEVTVGGEERRKWMVALKPMKRKGLFSLGPSWVKELTDIPERFDRHLYVLGSEVFKEYRCFWDVFVGSEGEWAVGVARESVKRKGKFIAGPTEGIWRIGKWGDQYRVSTCDGPPVLMLGGEPKRIRVALNCEGRRVSFYDANTAALLHSFSAASFSGETLQPFFYMFTKGHLTVS